MKVAKSSVFPFELLSLQKKNPKSGEIIMNIMGSVLKSCLSVHQQSCYYRLRSPARPGPSLYFWLPEIPNTSQKTRGLGLPWLVGAAEVVPIPPRGSQVRPGKLPPCLPFCPPFLSTEWELKGSCNENRSHSVNWCLQSSQPLRRERGACLPLATAPRGCAQHTFRDAPIWNSLLS